MKRININIKDRKVLYGILTIALVCAFTLTIAYAALNAVLTIQGSAQVSAVNWDIHLANPVVNSESTTTEVPVISGNTLTFNTTLNLPGDFYEFTVDVVNNGDIDAMIDSVTKNPELTSEQAKYLSYDITYQNGESITSKQLLAKKKTMPIKIRIEYRSDVVSSELPTTNSSLSLSLTLNYVQDDGNGSSVSNNGKEHIKLIADGSLDAIGTIVTIGSEQFYTIGTDGDNVKLLSMYNLHVGSSVDSDWHELPLENPTGMQDSTARGYYWVNDVATFPFIGTIVFSSDAQHGENYSSYNGSVVEGYVNNYKNILESNYGIEIEEARLITKDELISDDIGCSVENSSCEDAPRFIYLTTYWTGTAENALDVWNVHTHAYFGSSSYNYDDIFGIRPVIVISKSLF